MNVRNDYVDYLKGIAIILVVLGHCWLIDNSIFTFIYLFHMPLFFCISGFLFNNKSSFKKFVKQKAKRLLIPYTIFFIISALLSFLLFNDKYTFENLLKYYLLNGRYCSIVSNYALWYLPTFFIVNILFYFLTKLNIKWFILINIIILILIVPTNNYLYTIFQDGFIPYSLQAILPGIFYMGIGKSFKLIQNKIVINKWSMILIIIGFILGITMSFNIGNQILNITTIKYVISSLLIIPFVLMITYKNKNDTIRYIGKNSIIILGFHRIMLTFFELYGAGSFLEKYSLNNNIGGVVICTICIILILAFKEIIDYVLRKINIIKI